MIADSSRSQPTDPTKDFLSKVLRIHAQLVESLEWQRFDGDADPQDLRQSLRPMVEEICRMRFPELEPHEFDAYVSAALSEAFGLGPLDILLADSRISDILVNRWDEVFIERDGQLIRTNISFYDDAHVTRLIQRVAARIGRRLDEGSPAVDARLPDGSRVHAVVPPLAVRGPTMSIRRFAVKPLYLRDMAAGGSMSSAMAEFLAAAVTSRLSCLISGGTGAGKTTLLNALSANLPADERIVTIEDVSELRLVHPHIVSLEARHANVDGRGEVTIRELVRNSLRMRPDRIIVGEVRGPEAIDMLQALNTGHEGSLTTIHANDTRDALSRLEMMVGMGGGHELSTKVLRQYVAAGIRILVHVARLKGGVRRVMRVSELVGAENDQYHLEEIFGFKQQGLDPSGRASGTFYATGYLPKCRERIQMLDIPLDMAIFQPDASMQSN